jgi:hypothetical protein
VRVVDHAVLAAARSAAAASVAAVVTDTIATPASSGVSRKRSNADFAELDSRKRGRVETSTSTSSTTTTTSVAAVAAATAAEEDALRAARVDARLRAIDRELEAIDAVGDAPTLMLDAVPQLRRPVCAVVCVCVCLCDVLSPAYV